MCEILAEATFSNTNDVFHHTAFKGAVPQVQMY